MEHNIFHLSNFLSDLVDQLPGNNMFLKDINGNILWHNSYCIKDLKQPTNNLIDKTVFDLFSNESAQICKEHDIEAIQSNRTIIKNDELTLLNEEKKQYIIVKKPYINKHDQTIGILVNSINLTTFQQNLSMPFNYNINLNYINHLLQQLHLNFKLPLQEILLMANLIEASTSDNYTKILSKEIVDFSKNLLINYNNIINLNTTSSNHNISLEFNQKINLRILLIKLINLANNQAKHRKLTIILQISNKIPSMINYNYLYINKILNLMIKNLIKSTIFATNIFLKVDIIDNMILFSFESKSYLSKIKFRLINQLITELNGTINFNNNSKKLLKINILLPLN